MILPIQPILRDSLDSYNKHIFIYRNHLIIPYINLQIIEPNTIADFKEYDFLDFSFIILKDVSYFTCDSLSFGMNQLFFGDKKENSRIDYFTANKLNKKIGSSEIKVEFVEEYLYFDRDVKIGNKMQNMWIPIETPNFKQNIETEIVNDFFDKKNIPTEVLALVGAKDYSEIKAYMGNEQSKSNSERIS